MADETEPETATTIVTPAANAGTTEGVNRQRRKKVNEVQEAAIFWRDTLSTPRGRKEIWGLIGKAHPFSPIFGVSPVGMPVPEETWMHAGEQRIGYEQFLYLFSIARPEVLLMISENDPRVDK